MSVRVFRQIMDHLVVDLGKYEFVDFGSGKGRVLLLAWEYGFRRVTGVEFAPELHRVSAANIAILARDGRKRSKVETVCMDATEFAIPQAPVVLFFYSPFKGQVMERVLRNVLASFAACPREMALVFYGDNAQSIDLFKATKWPYKELALHADWSRFTNYRGFIFASPPV